MLVGYCRVSTEHQDLYMQKDVLKDMGCKEIYSDVASGIKSSRPGLENALAYLREGDTLVVWKLDRLGRSLQHLIQTISSLEKRNIAFKSIQENIDTSTSGGKLIFHLFSALAEFERDIIIERTKAGLNAARKRGRLGGRPKLLTPKQVRRLRELYYEGNSTIAEICKIYNITKPTFYNYLKS